MQYCMKQQKKKVRNIYVGSRLINHNHQFKIMGFLYITESDVKKCHRIFIQHYHFFMKTCINQCWQKSYREQTENMVVSPHFGHHNTPYPTAFICLHVYLLPQLSQFYFFFSPQRALRRHLLNGCMDVLPQPCPTQHFRG